MPSLATTYDKAVLSSFSLASQAIKVRRDCRLNFCFHYILFALIIYILYMHGACVYVFTSCDVLYFVAAMSSPREC